MSRGAATIFVLGALVMTGWAGAATWFIINRDEIAARALAREADLQFAYETRLSTLRAQIDRIASRQLINQDGVDERLDQLIGRQAQIETRHQMLADLARAGAGRDHPAAMPEDPALSQAPAPATGSLPRRPPLITSDKPMPAMEVPPLRGVNRAPRGASLFGDPLAERRAIAARPVRSIESVDSSLKRVEAEQMAVAQAMEASAREASLRLKRVLADTGLGTSFGTHLPADPVGGPFVPANGKSGPFEAMLDNARIAMIDREALGRTVAALPIGRPVSGELDVTSSFGYRLDPFTRSPALHSGVDFRGDTGSPVRATAPGTVTVAEWSGGYGRLVEIDHGNGLTTRYGHLSSISVSPGDMVDADTVIGRVGATGRATGPHLHYETRLDDNPIDPTRFLKAGMRLKGGEL